MHDNDMTFPDQDFAPQSLTVMFLHHFGGSSKTWHDVVIRLNKFEPGVHCLAPDLHGFGASGNPPKNDAARKTGSFNYSVDAYADDVAELLSAQGVKHYLLVGHSMGGKIAQALAGRSPVGLEGVLLVAPSPPTPEPMSDSDREQLMQAREDTALALKVVSAITFRPLSEAMQQQTVDDILRSSPAAWRAWLDAGSREDISNRMSEINVPVVVLAAGHDTAMSASLLRREVIGRIAGSRLIVVPDSAHLVPLDAPAAIVRLVRDMITLVDATQQQRDRKASSHPVDGAARTAYPPGTVRELLATDAVTEPTRQVLKDRLNTTAESHPQFLSDAEMNTLRAICGRLIPQPNTDDFIDIAAALDTRLASRHGKGWRYEVLPNDRETYRLALQGIDEDALAAFSRRFCELGEIDQDEVLSSVQCSKVAGGGWTNVPPARFFEDLLAEASEIYFSHPLAQERIGYVGMADKHGWTQIGLNTLAPREPMPQGVSHE